MSSRRVLIVSNRLPVAVRARGERVQLVPSTGGLATGLRGPHEGSGGLWIGWPGDVSPLTPQQRGDLERQLAARAIVPVHLSRDQIERYYHGFANRVVWPLFHYLIDRIPVDAAGWDAYRHANETFADAVAACYQPGDAIWIHDYQLMLLPQLVRERLPSARIGFFLHIPFPSSEVFRTLPWRSQILTGLLGADLIGFHTFAYLRHFLASLLHVDGVESDVDRVRLRDRDVQIGVFPMGIDAAEWAAIAGSAEAAAASEAIRRDAGGRQIILGVDRLDYTKGIPRRLQAIERLLGLYPELRSRIRYVQVAVPSRGAVDSYQRFKREVEETVGRINGRCGTLDSTPIHYVHQSVSRHELAGLFRAADVMAVTPLRDGMNLVAKEFVASRVDDTGVLVLSEFAGAAAELDGALTINPYDVDALARTLHRALTMPAEDARVRMRKLRSRVLAHDVHAWAHDFLARLEAARVSDETEPATGAAPGLPEQLAAARARGPLRILLDYDGTLVPIVRAPNLAAPDEGVLALLARLAAAEGVRVEIVSGRPRESLDRWFSDLPIALWAEHGFWRRSSPAADWESMGGASDRLQAVERLLEQFATSTPGAVVERKSASVAWHYRRADREFGLRQAHELRMLLSDALSNLPFEVVEGKKILEVRPSGVSKGLVARRILQEVDAETQLVAIGDDRTDDDMFRALPDSAITIAVGSRPTCARFHVGDFRDVRELLSTLDTPPPAHVRRAAFGKTREDGATASGRHVGRAPVLTWPDGHSRRSKSQFGLRDN